MSATERKSVPFLNPARVTPPSACASASAGTARARLSAIALELKSVEDDGAFEGYASLFEREDLGRDVIAPGAFRDSLAGRRASQIKMLFQHDPAQPIGVWEEIREDAKGLYVRGRLMMAVEKAREVLALMRAGGDSWEVADVPLAEDAERYEIDILDGATVKRTITATARQATYTAAEQIADFGGLQASVTINVVQVSSVFGRGERRTATV